MQKQLHFKADLDQFHAWFCVAQGDMYVPYRAFSSSATVRCGLQEAAKANLQLRGLWNAHSAHDLVICDSKLDRALKVEHNKGALKAHCLRLRDRIQELALHF